jgi:hypothetical protein
MFETINEVQIKNNTSYTVTLKFGETKYVCDPNDTTVVPASIASIYFLYRADAPAAEKVREEIIEGAYRRTLNYNLHMTLEQCKEFIDKAEISPLITGYKFGDDNITAEELEEAIVDIKSKKAK